MADSSTCINLLDQRSSVDVATPLGWLYMGPNNLLWYTFIQGAFTVLAIKEVVSIASVCVKGRSSNLNIRRVIAWYMVTNWEDLRKMTERILKPCTIDIWRRLLSCIRGGKSSRINNDNGDLQTYSKEHSGENEPVVSGHGWALLLMSGLVALALFCTDLGLVVLSAPSLHKIDASQVQTLAWSNNASIPILTKENVLRGSFSRAITKEAIANDVEFSSQASVSLERTYFDDFRELNAVLPPYNGTFLTCDASEGWRIVCKIYTERNLYQYKLRLDTSTVAKDDDLFQYFVPVYNFSIRETSTRNTRSLAEYMDAMNEQLGLNVTLGWKSNTHWMINSIVQPKAFTNIDGENVLMHDAIASLVLGSINICAGSTNSMMYQRRRGERKVYLKPIRGTVARSQRPRAPLLTTIFAYGFLALVSGILQWKRRVGDVAKDFHIVLEVLAQRIRSSAGVLNIRADPLPMITSRTSGRRDEFSDEQYLRVSNDPINGDLVILTHKGFLPARAMALLSSYMRDRLTLAKEDPSEFRRKWDIV